MAYHTLGGFQKKRYSATALTSGGTAVAVVTNRARLVEIFQGAQVSQTAAAGSWTASLNGNQITGLSSIAVSSGVAGVQQTSGSPSSPTYLARGDVISVTGSSLTASSYQIVVQEF